MHDPPRIGVVGAGQLARMTIQAAISLGLQIRLLAERADDSAALISPAVMLGSPNSLSDLMRFAETCDVVTFDHELVNVEHLCRLEEAGYCLRPSANTVAIAQDKGKQRRLFASLSLPIPPYRLLDRPEDAVEFGDQFGWPIIGKTCREGYDGRGVWLLESSEAARTWGEQGLGTGRQLLVEGRVLLERELAVLIARRPGGDSVTYPVVETMQREGVCRQVRAPAPVGAALAAEAMSLAERIAAAIDASGILAVELFQSGEQLLINEIACRPHNSGHYTIEGSGTSQFENHLRAVLDWPLGKTDLRAPAAVMANVLAVSAESDSSAALPRALAVPGVHPHLYAKAPRPRRKIGHVTALGADVEEASARADQAAALLSGEVVAQP